MQMAQGRGFYRSPDMKHIRIDALPEEGVTHNANIRKRVILRGGELGPLTQLARSTFPPGEVATGHSHADMAEVFCVDEGEGTIIIDGEAMRLSVGSVVVVYPGEHHELANGGEVPLVVTYFGLRLDLPEGG